MALTSSTCAHCANMGNIQYASMMSTWCELVSFVRQIVLLMFIRLDHLLVAFYILFVSHYIRNAEKEWKYMEWRKSKTRFDNNSGEKTAIERRGKNVHYVFTFSLWLKHYFFVLFQHASSAQYQFWMIAHSAVGSLKRACTMVARLWPGTDHVSNWIDGSDQVLKE